MMRVFIYILAFLELVLLLFFVAQYASGSGRGGDSGGAEMALFFLTLAPLVMVSGATAVFHFTRWPVLRWTAAVVIAVPLLTLGAWKLDDLRYSFPKRDYASGRGYFTDPSAQALAEAVVRGDAAAVAAAARTADVRQAGEMGQTALGLALTRSDFNLAVVQALLDGGADPDHNHGWPLGVAISRDSAPLMTMLLDAGADPNRPDSFEQPIFFTALDRPDMLALLLRRGGQVDAVDRHGRTALMRAAWDRGWPAVTLLLAAGADIAHVARDGTGLQQVAAFARHQAEVGEQPIEPELLALEARLRRLAGE